MKAIKLKQNVKESNPDLFVNREVGEIFQFNIPSNFKRGQDTLIGYELRIDLHTEDGINDIILPSGIDFKLKRLSGEVIEIGGDFVYEVLDLTVEEIEQNSIITMPRRDFKMALLKNHDITNSSVDTLFEYLLTNNLATSIIIESMKLMWYESATFKSNTAELFQFASTLSATNPDIDITQTQLEKIFTDYEAQN